MAAKNQRLNQAFGMPGDFTPGESFDSEAIEKRRMVKVEEREKRQAEYEARKQEKERQKQVQTLLAEQWSTMDDIARGPFLAQAQSKLDALLKLYVQLFAETATRLGVAFSEDDRACVEIAFRMLIEQRGLTQIDTWLSDGTEKQFAEPGGGGSIGAFGSSSASSFGSSSASWSFGHQVSGQM